MFDCKYVVVADAAGRFWAVVQQELWYHPGIGQELGAPGSWKKASFWPDFLQWKDGSLSLIDASASKAKLCNCSAELLFQQGCKCGGI